MSDYSTLVITLFIAIGAFFFIRASVRDRTQREQFISEVAPETLQQQMELYFKGRAYQLIENGEVRTYRGTVAASSFLALFLSVLAAGVLGSLAIILVTLVPSVGGFWFLLLVLSPGAGLFYWQRARRPEIVRLKVVVGPQKTEVHIQAHRDELERFKAALGFTEE